MTEPVGVVDPLDCWTVAVSVTEEFSEMLDAEEVSAVLVLTTAGFAFTVRLKVAE